MSVIVENVELFKDFNLSDSWNKSSSFDKDGFKVEFKDGKARVYTNTPFCNRERSNFAKLHQFGGWSGGGKDVRGYSLTVNGQRVYFRIDVVKHKID